MALNSDTSRGFMKAFMTGFTAPMASVGVLVRNPRIWAVAAPPFFISLGLYAAFFFFGFSALKTALYQWLTASFLVSWLPSFLFTTLLWIVNLLILGILGFIAAITFTLVSSLVSSPFNEALSRSFLKALMKEAGFKMPTLTSHTTLAGLWTEAKRLSILVLGGVFVLLVGWIPFFQIPALALGSLFLSFEYFGYPMSHHHLKLIPIAWWIKKNIGMSLGFGCFLLLLMVIPFTSIFYIPLAVMGATKIFFESGFYADSLSSRR